MCQQSYNSFYLIKFINEWMNDTIHKDVLIIDEVRMKYVKYQAYKRKNSEKNKEKIGEKDKKKDTKYRDEDTKVNKEKNEGKNEKEDEKENID